MPLVSIGAKGVISVTANVKPAESAYIYEFAKNNDYFNARRWANYLFELNKTLFLDVNPICVKHYLNLIGFNVGKNRLPLTEPNEKIKQKLKKLKEEYEN